MTMSMVRLLNFTIIKYLCHSPKDLHINDLPVDIFTEIFRFSVPNDPLNHQQPNARMPPISLCQVCSNWRRLAFDMPTLWLHLNYVFTVPGEKYHTFELEDCIRPVDIQFLDWWIRNSQGRPLVFRFELDFTRRPSMQVVQPAPFLHIISNARGLYLNEFGVTLLQRQLSRQNLKFPNLRSLVNIINDGSAPATPESLLHLGTLRHLVYHNPQTLDDSICWASLTHISIRMLYISGTGWCTLIRCLDALQVGEFSANVDTPIYDTPVVYLSKELPHLRELRLLLYFRNPNFNPLPNLLLPALTRLHYDGLNMRTNFLYKLFLASPRLATLHLGSSTLEKFPLEHTFKYTKFGWGVWRYALRLEELIIDDFDTATNELWWLNFRSHHPPNLRHLVLVHFTYTLFFSKGWRLEFMKWYLPLTSRINPINVVFREEDYMYYWRLPPSEHRAWIEIWYVVAGYVQTLLFKPLYRFV